MYFLETLQVRAPCHGGVLYIDGMLFEFLMNVFLTFYAISNISRKKIWEYKTIILMFSSCFFLYAGNIE